MDEDFINPQAELERLDKAIVKYQLLLKTTTDAGQKHTYSRKLNELKAYRGKILYIFDQNKDQEKAVEQKRHPRNFLNLILKQKKEQAYSPDDEINTLCHYLHFFDKEFLTIFSERKMKLDFKFSLDRENFHYKFQELARRKQDYLEEAARLRQGELHKEMQLELRRRNMQKKRNLLIESHKFFRNLQTFTVEIVKDLNSSQLICLNGDDIINYDLMEGKRFLEGYTLRDAMHQLYDFIAEVTAFLNIPEID